MRFSSLLPALLALTVSVQAAPYIVTNYIVLSVYTYSGYTRTYTTKADSVYTNTRNVASPTGTVSPITTVTTSGMYRQVTLVNVVVPTGSQLTETDYLAFPTYVVPITYRPSATCTGQSWSVVSTVSVYIPDIVTLSASTFVTASTRTYAHLNPSSTSWTVRLVNPTDVAADDLAAASSNFAPYGLRYCYTPTMYCPTATAAETAAQCTQTFVSPGYTTSNSGGTYYNGYYDDYDNKWLRDMILICVLVPVGWLLIWFLIGLGENWASFKGLMLGQKRKRGMPYSFCCISCFCLCFVGPTYEAKSAEEQAVLLERWKAMKKREKLKLWLKYGFRWKYPEVLGAEPAIAKRALRQGCL